MTLTISVSVTEDWRNVENTWTMRSRDGTASEVTAKHVPNWDERTSDHFIIWTGSEVRVSRTKFLKKSEDVFQSPTDQKLFTVHDWEEQYDIADGATVVHKQGFESESTVSQSTPVNSSLNDSTVLTIWSGPAQWTEKHENDTSQSYNNGVKTFDNSMSLSKFRSFSSNTAQNPDYEDWFFTNSTLQWYVPSGNLLSAHAIKRVRHWDNNIPFNSVATWEYDTQYVDEVLRRAQSDSATYTYVEDNALLPQVAFSRSTSYLASGAAESLFWRYKTNFPGVVGVDKKLALEWNAVGSLDAVSVDGAAWMLPLTDEQWNTLTGTIYPEAQAIERMVCVVVPDWAYPGLSQPPTVI